MTPSTELRDELAKLFDAVYDRELQITYALDEAEKIVRQRERAAVEKAVEHLENYAKASGGIITAHDRVEIIMAMFPLP